MSDKEMKKPIEKEVTTTEEKTTKVEEKKVDNDTLFNVGDTIRVDYKIIEGSKERLQPFNGIVIGKKGSDISKTFIIRRICADGVFCERILPVYSPKIANIEVLKRGKVRRAKLYYLRNKIGKKAYKIKEKK